MTVDLSGFERIRLVGDEDCGVGLECLDCWDGGRPLAYLPGIGAYYDDLLVAVVDNVPDLLTAGRRHLDEKHS